MCMTLVSSSLMQRGSMFVSVIDAFKAEISHGSEKTSHMLGSDSWH